jgi:hypothetical protein
MDDFLEAVDKTADTSFNASDIEETFGKNTIAERRSGSAIKGFYRPGERDRDGTPFEPVQTKCPKYHGPPSGRIPTNEEKRGAWQLQEEYLAGRLGKNDEENSRNWNTAKWIDRLFRTATTPADAVKSLNLCADGWEDAFSYDYEDPEADPDEKNEGFGLERFKINELDKKRITIQLSDYDLARLSDYFKEHDELAKIDIDKVVRDTDPLPESIDLPGPIERQEAIKIVRMLMLGMRSLWHPVIRAIAGHATMKSLGKTQGAGDGVAAAVGRQRVIEGLRLAESIRKGLARRECGSARQEVVSSEGWCPSVDEIIREVLAVLPRCAAKPLHANDNYCVGAVISKAA